MGSRGHAGRRVDGRGATIIRAVWLAALAIGTGGGPALPVEAGERAEAVRAVFVAHERTEPSDAVPVLYVTDGTTVGTRRIRELPQVREIVSLGNGRAVMAVGRDLWVTDGTFAGTRRLRPFAASPEGLNPAGLVRRAVGSVMFAGDTWGLGRELWVTDGTDPGTYFVRDIARGPGHSQPSNLAALGDGRVLFSALDPATGVEPWVSGGTRETTLPLGDLRPGTEGSRPQSFGVVGEGLAGFSADDGVRGREPWLTDGTAAGTRLLADLRPGPSGSSPRSFSALAPGLFLFSAEDVQAGYEPFLSTGSAPGTRLLRDTVPGREGGLTDVSPRFVALSSGRALFWVRDPRFGSVFARARLWVTDGTWAGTRPLRDLTRTVVGLHFHGDSATRFGPAWALVSADGSGTGVELWITDGTAAGTRLVRDIWPGSDPWRASSDPQWITPLGTGLALFSAADSEFLWPIGDDGELVFDRELWITNGTSRGTRRLADISPGPLASDPWLFAVLP